MEASGADRLASLDMIRRLVAFDTVSRKSNLEAINFVRGYLEDRGVKSVLIPDATGSKASIYATVGPQDRPGILLSGHTDVVPVDGQDWTSDPFVMVERDDRLIARGTADMKGFLGAVLSLVPEMVAANLETPIHLALTYDEEVGCIGVRPLIDMLNTLPVRPAMCVVGEPTGMRVVHGHKGKISKRVRVRGRACHSSQAPEGVNAVEYAAELITHIRGMTARFAAEGPKDPSYSVPYTTGHVGRVEGGIALNIVPEECCFDFEFRHLPAQKAEDLIAEVMSFASRQLEPRMRAVDPGSGFDWEPISSFPGLDTDPEAEVVRLVTSLAGQGSGGKVAFGTEAGLFSAGGGIPAVVCGPGCIDQAHKPDEYVTLEQIGLCEAFLRRLIAWARRP